VCSAGGKFCSDSTEFLVCVGNRISRFDVILSHIMNRNTITLTNEIADPIDRHPNGIRILTIPTPHGTLNQCHFSFFLLFFSHSYHAS
jgi:hypothetical protein